MKNIIFASILSATLAACGAGASQDIAQSPATASVISAPAQTSANEHKFVVSFLGNTGEVEGFGKDSKDAAYDALAYMASNVWKPGTDAYRAMISNAGMSVIVVERANARSFRAVVKVSVQGLVIDVQGM